MTNKRNPLWALSEPHSTPTRAQTLTYTLPRCECCGGEGGPTFVGHLCTERLPKNAQAEHILEALNNYDAVCDLARSLIRSNYSASSINALKHVLENETSNGLKYTTEEG